MATELTKQDTYASTSTPL